MAFGAKKTAEQLFTESEQVDLTKATLAPDLSYSDLDAESSTFSVTIDRIAFRKAYEIVSTVLEANGYAENFENLLACFDSLMAAVRVRGQDRATAGDLVVAKSYLPALSFQLPSKNKVGPLLKKFYAEIEGYELELARLRSGDLDDSGEKKKSREQLKRELDHMKSENMRLQATVARLTTELAQAMKSTAHVTKALESNNIIPPQLKPVLVREISLQERTIILKSGRSAYTLPLFFLRSLPKIGDPCLLNIKDDQIIDAYFYETPGREFHQEIADVLHVNELTCKLRDSIRKTHIWTARHEPEKGLFANLKRGSKVIISSIDDVIVKLSVVSDQNEGLWAEKVMDQQTQHQLERARQGDAGSLPIFDRKD